MDKRPAHLDVAYFMLNGNATRDVEGFYLPVRMGK